MPGGAVYFVASTLGEEVAIETLKRGAADYVLKHRLSRLVPAVRRALDQARERAERRRANQLLRRSHDSLRALSIHLQHLREEERGRVAHDVQEELGQALAALKLQLVWLKRHLDLGSSGLKQKTHAMAGRIDKTIKVARRIATELRPGVLDEAGLPAALEWQAQQFETQTGIRCRVRTDVKQTPGDQELKTALFRIFQEALDNVVRHPEATHAEVRLRQTDGHLVLKITDDGHPALEPDVQDTNSIGLCSMRERAVVFGGDVRVRGLPARGTVVRVRIPLPPLSPPSLQAR